MSGRRNSNTMLLQELEELSETMYQSHTTRRTTSLALPRTAIPPILPTDVIPDNNKNELNLNPKPRSRRMSLSPWRSRPNPNPEPPLINKQAESTAVQKQNKFKWADDDPASASTSDKKGIWNWKPIRALSHIGMQKLSCLFSVEVVTVQNLPASMNGLRLSVCVRKKENRDGAVQTMPSRVSQGAADFEETLFIRCHVYYTPGTTMKFEPRPFLVYVLAIDAEELDFGKSGVDLSGLILESTEKNVEGTRVRQWDTSFKLSGKAKGGELVLKLGFQIMEKDGGIGIYSQAEGQKTGKSRTFSPSVGRKQSKTSFSVPSPRMTSRAEAWTPSQKVVESEFQGIDDLNLDEPAPPLSSPINVKSDETEVKIEDNDLPDFEVVEKGVEILGKDGEDKKESEDEKSEDESSEKREVVKEIVQDQSHIARMSELDSIAQQIKALESLMIEENSDVEESGSQKLDADEDKVTREFLQMLEVDPEEDDKVDEISVSKPENIDEDDQESNVYLPDLGKGLGCVVQTRNGGYLAAVNPLDSFMTRKDTPKLAMQMSKPLILQSNQIGFELFQKMAANGVEELTSEIISLMPIDELNGKTAEQIAFEGIASAIIQGRNKEGASSTAARTIASVKSMANAMNSGRTERISTGIWNVSEVPLTIDEILSFSMQKIESMAVDALRIQADMAEEDAPFDVSPLAVDKVYDRLLDSAVPIEDWNIKVDDSLGKELITMSLVVQLRDPVRQYEAVGGPLIALIHANGVDEEREYGVEEKRYKVGSLQVGGIKVKSSESKSVFDSEKQRLTALQWLVAYGLGKAGKKGKRVGSKGPDILWSISSRVMADMWLKPIRNPDVKFK